MGTFKFNGEEYEARTVDFEYLVFADKLGVDTDHLFGVAGMNCYLSYCTGMREREAAAAINEYVINNSGKFPEEVMDAYLAKCEESGFFRALDKGQEADKGAAETEEEIREETTEKKATRKSATK